MEHVKAEIRQALQQAIERAAAAGELSGAASELPLETPRDKQHGDYATGVAMAMARAERKAPRLVAEAIVRHFPFDQTWVERCEVAGPGFINFFLRPGWLHQALVQIQTEGDDYGRSQHGGGRRVLVEFVSANPTGPMVVVQARAAAAGDTLCNLLDRAGYAVAREFYVNDAGRQVMLLAQTLEARLRQELGQEAAVPEDGYPGEYVIDLARQYLAAEGAAVLAEPEQARWAKLGRWATEQIRAGQEQVLAAYGVRFDAWFSEQHLRSDGWPERVIDWLRQRGHVYDRDGAVWFRSTAFGDDKDRVLVKSTGEYTYFAVDACYHLNKYQRGFDTLINIWGQDHHGYVGRMQAMVAALGYPAASFELLITQIVHLVRSGAAVKMSKRRGEFVLMQDLLDEVDVSACRFFFLMRSLDSHLEFDLDLARLQDSSNPVYYVQYAHARIASLLAQAAAQGHTVPRAADLDLTVLADDAEYDLLRRLADYPREIIEAADAREPHRLTRYVHELATTFHQFYTRCRVISDDAALTAARLVLADATRTVLKNALDCLGVAAPERM